MAEMARKLLNGLRASVSRPKVENPSLDQEQMEKVLKYVGNVENVENMLKDMLGNMLGNMLKT